MGTTQINVTANFGPIESESYCVRIAAAVSLNNHAIRSALIMRVVAHCDEFDGAFSVSDSDLRSAISPVVTARKNTSSAKVKLPLKCLLAD